MQQTTNALRRTKIIATLGPASIEKNSLKELLEAHVDLVRLNLSHGTHQDYEQTIKFIRNWSKNNKREIGIIADLQGAKIRVGEFENKSITLKDGQSFTFDTNDSSLGNSTKVSVSYPTLAKDLTIGDILLLDDGLIKMTVTSIDNHLIHCQVNNNGVLSNHKGLNKFGGGLDAPAFTKKDRDDLAFALAMQVDYIAISFVKDQNDILEIKKIINANNSDARTIAKIERKEAIDNLDEIIMSADALMVARGDLGIELGIEEIPALQKLIIARSRSLNKPVITATQMMESMTTNTIPTRAEVSDIANAIFDCTDAIMFSAETATGKHPNLVVSSANTICLSSERNPVTSTSQHRIECTFEKTDEAIAMATMYIANHQNIAAIISLTESGTTPLWMSRIKSNIPIYALSPHVATIRRMTLYRDVYPIIFDHTQYTYQSIEKEAINDLIQRNLINKGELVLVTHGDIIGAPGKTNSVKILEV